jgi:hypothetical protein
MIQMTIITDIGRLFTETGTALVDAQHPQDNSGRIRDLQTQIVAIINQSSVPSSLYCFMFLLDLLVDDIFYNMSGDAPYSNTHLSKVRDAVFAQVGKTFVEIGTNLAIPEAEVPWSSLSELVAVYLNELHNLDEASQK